MLFRQVSAFLTLVAAQVVAQEPVKPVIDIPQNSTCPTSSTLTCTFTDTNEDCCELSKWDEAKKKLVCADMFFSADECGERPVRVDYKICNEYDNNDIAIIAEREGIMETYLKFNNEEVEFNKNNMDPGECRSRSKEGVMDTCKDKFTYSLQLQGWRSDKYDIDGYYCRTYKYNKIKSIKRLPVKVPECSVSVDVTCVYNDGSKCADFDHDENECETRDVNIGYEYCNTNVEDSINLLPVITRAKFRSELLDLDLTKMSAGECRSETVKRTMNNCNDKKFVFSFKLEGWLDNFEGEDGAYCFGWAFSEVKLSPPAIDLQVKCYIKDAARTTAGFVWRECSTITITKGEDCVRDLRYEYTITNESNNAVRAEQIILNAVDDHELVPLSTDGVSRTIQPTKSITISHFVTKNLCLSNGRVLNEALAVAVNTFGGAAGTAENGVNFDVVVDDFNWFLTDVRCYIERTNQLCKDYIDGLTDPDECFQDVIIKFDIGYEGLGCAPITSAVSFLGDGIGDPIVLDKSNIGCDVTKLCDGQTLSADKQKTLDLCSYTNEPVPFGVQLNDGEVQTLLIQLAAPNFPSPPTRAPQAEEVGDVRCISHPTKMLFKYLPNPAGKLCHTSANQLTNFFDDCHDFCANEDPAEINISRYFSSDHVDVGEIICVENNGKRLDANLSVIIYTTSKAQRQSSQEFTVHSSCSKPIFLGDTFGALKLVGWDNDQGSVRTPGTWEEY